jgi:hypothetical protein
VHSTSTGSGSRAPLDQATDDLVGPGFRLRFDLDLRELAVYLTVLAIDDEAEVLEREAVFKVLCGGLCACSSPTPTPGPTFRNARQTGTPRVPGGDWRAYVEGNSHGSSDDSGAA